MWSDVLSAYDAEIPLLKAMRAEYDAFVGGSLQAAWARLSPGSTDLAEIDVSAEDGVMGATVRLRGESARAGLELQFWPAVEYGGPVATLRWVLVLPRTFPEGYPPLAKLVALAREASNALPTEPVEGGPADLATLTDHAMLRWGAMPLGDADLPVRVAKVLEQGVAAMSGAAPIILAQYSTTPRSWLESVLFALHDEGAFLTAAAVSSNRGAWAPGAYVNARRTPTDYTWFTACNDGRLAFHWDAGRAQKEVRRAAALARFAGSETFLAGGYHGIVLLDPSAVAARQAAGDVAGVRTLILDTWRAYSELAAKSSGAT